MTIVLVIIGAAIGAPLRYLADRKITARLDSVFPFGILAVNVFGSLVLGFLFGGAQTNVVSAPIATLLGTGFCGALTTYSTFGYDTVRLMRDAPAIALASAAANVAGGCAAALVGFVIAHAAF
jgi:CrcB protein